MNLIGFQIVESRNMKLKLEAFSSLPSDSIVNKFYRRRSRCWAGSELIQLQLSVEKAVFVRVDFLSRGLCNSGFLSLTTCIQTFEDVVSCVF